MSWGINRKNNEACGEQFSFYSRCLYKNDGQELRLSNQDLRLKITIANYTNRCFVLIHRVIQFLRYIVLFGHTEWNNTKDQYSSVVAKNLTKVIRRLLLRSDNPQFKTKIQQLAGTSGSPIQQAANEAKEYNKLAATIVKQINVQGYVNKIMCDLLKINNANTAVPENNLNYQVNPTRLTHRKLTDIIIEKDAKKIAQAFIAFYEPNKAQQVTLLANRNTFNNMDPLIYRLTFP